MREHAAAVTRTPIAGFTFSSCCGLFVVAAVLTAVSFGLQWVRFGLGHDRLFGLVALFDVGREGNVPSWFSSAILLFAALLLWIVAAVERRRGTPGAWRWVVLGAVAALLSLDEAASLHEQMRLRNFGIGSGDAFLWRSWTVPVGAAVLAAGACCIPFLRALPAVTRTRFIVAAVVYFGAAVGLEVVGALHAIEHGQLNLTYAALASLEEFLEMAGVILLIRAVLLHLDLIGATPTFARAAATAGD